MSIARDLLSEREYWHATYTVARETGHPSARLSSFYSPTSAVIHPLTEQHLMAQAVETARAFRAAAKLPPFLSLNETMALKLLGSAVYHHHAEKNAAPPSGREAAEFLSLAVKQVYGGVEGIRNVDALAAQLEAAGADPDMIHENLLVSGAHMRASFDKQFWPAKALTYAPRIEETLRCDAAEAAGLSTFFYVANACGVSVEDPNFVYTAINHLSGFDGNATLGTARQFCNTRELDALAGAIVDHAKSFTDDDVNAATRAVLLQATATHAKLPLETVHVN